MNGSWETCSGAVGSRPHNDVTEAILLKRDVNVVQALPIQADRFSGKVGNSVERGQVDTEDLMH